MLERWLEARNHPEELAAVKAITFENEVVIDTVLKTGANTSIKYAATGTLKVGVEKGIITATPIIHAFQVDAPLVFAIIKIVRSIYFTREVR